MKVCIVWGIDTHQKAWDYLLMACDIWADDIYVVVLEGFDSKIPPPSKITGSANIITSIEHLPPGPLVVACPEVANHMPGNTSLYECVHPEDAIYVFGADNISFHPNMFGERAVGQKVYVPSRTDTHMNSHVAAAMILYDRRYKQWLTR